MLTVPGCVCSTIVGLQELTLVREQLQQCEDKLVHRASRADFERVQSELERSKVHCFSVLADRLLTLCIPRLWSLGKQTNLRCFARTRS